MGKEESKEELEAAEAEEKRAQEEVVEGLRAVGSEIGRRVGEGRFGMG